MIALLLLQLAMLGTKPLPPIVAMTGESRTYHRVPLAKVKDTQWTHISVCGRVEYVKREADGDGHLRIVDSEPGSRIPTFIVAEIVPYHPLPLPKVGSVVQVAGVSRFDKQHRWYEVHPVESLTILPTCATSKAGS